jgi:hypothetical protein
VRDQVQAVRQQAHQALACGDAADGRQAAGFVQFAGQAVQSLAE